MAGDQAMTNRAGADWGGRLRLMGWAVEWLIVTASIVVIAGCLVFLWVLVFDPERGSELTSGLRPIQFYRELDAELLEDYGEVFAVGHNSGDSIEATLTAIRYGADVIEVDVISLDGQLYAAHGAPIRWLGGTVFRGPPLAQVWIATAGAGAIKLDLKESTPAFHELVLDFLADRRGQRQVTVVSGEPDVLRLFAEREPTVFRFLGAGDGDRLRAIDDDPEVAEIVDVISIRHTLIDEERAAWLEEHDLLTLAWTVNDLERVGDHCENLWQLGFGKQPGFAKTMGHDLDKSLFSL